MCSPDTGRREKVALGYAVSGDSTVQTTQSGVAKALGTALDRRPELSLRRFNTGLSDPELWLAAALNYRRGRDRWQWAAHNGPRAARIRTRRLLRAMEKHGKPDLVLPLRHPYRQIPGVPYAPYIDNTVQVARRNWPRSAPWSSRQLADVLETERGYLRGADHVLVTGQLIADSVVSDYEVEPSRVTVVGAGSHYERVAPATTTEPRHPWVLFVGYDFARKGGDLLARAFSQVRSRHPQARLKVVGPSSVASGPGVDVLGPIWDRASLSQLYAQSAAFALPARYEPYGISYLEAMAHGLPCIGTRQGAVAEIIEDGRTGYIVEPEDVDALSEALDACLSDPERARRMGDEGRRRVAETLNWDAVADRIVSAVGIASSRPVDVDS